MAAAKQHIFSKITKYLRNFTDLFGIIAIFAHEF